METDKETKNLITDRKSKCLRFLELILCEPKIIPYNLWYVAFYAAIASVFPYLAVYYEQLGLTPLMIGACGFVRPLLGSIFAPLGGAIADRFRLRKTLLILSCIAWLACYVTIGHIPPPERKNSCPDELLSINFTKKHEDTWEHVRKWMFISGDVDKVFLYIMLCLGVGEIFGASIGALGDVALMKHLDGNNMSRYSISRAWGAFGMGCFMLLTGAILNSTVWYVQVCGLNIEYSDYHVLFYIFAGAIGVTTLISCTFEYEYDTDRTNNRETSIQNTTQECETEASQEVDSGNLEQGVTPCQRQATYSIYDLIRCICTIHFVSWFGVISFMGMCNGIILSFISWYISLLGGSPVVLGTALGVASFSEFIFFFFSHSFVKWAGTINTIYVGLIGYVIRFINYAFAQNPWLIIPSEVLQGFTFATVWTALIYHVMDTFPIHTHGTVLGLLHGLYWGFGFGTGSLLGGALIDLVGARMAFVVFLAATIIIFPIFYLFQRLSTKPTFSKLEEEAT